MHPNLYARMAAIGAVLLVSACGDGQPLRFGAVDEPTEEPTDPTEEEEPTPAELTAGNLTEAIYNDGSNTLTVFMRSLDSTPDFVDYDRNPALDIGDYDAYSIQEDELDRFFTAFARDTSGVQGVLVMDGGQFNRYFGGTQVSQEGPYSPHSPSQPNNGLVSYRGDYVGLSNIDAPRPNQALPVDPGTPGEFIPGQATRVTGTVLINADFTDNTVNGAVAERVLVEYAEPIPTINLIVTDIQDDGSFGGIVETVVDEAVGTYSGVFGGTGATGIAGGVFLNGDFIPGVDGENEYGLFVLVQCGSAGDDPSCDQVNPQ